MDDDLSGTVDLSESIEVKYSAKFDPIFIFSSTFLFHFKFVREELQIKEKDRMDKRQKAFHQNDDEFISVDDLWCRWVNSEGRHYF